MDAVTRSLLYTDAAGRQCVRRGAVVCYEASDLVDWAIRLGSGGRFVHCALSLGDGNLALEARYGFGVHTCNAFVQIPFEARMIPAGQREASIHAVQTALGRPYDLCGWLSVLARHRLFGGGPPAAFHCSSLIAWAWPRTWGKPARAVSPTDIFNAGDTV